MKQQLRCVLFSVFILPVLVAWQNNSLAQAQQQKAMPASQPVGELNKQPEKKYDSNNSNKLVTIEGNPHPQQNLQQKENPSQNNNKQSKDNTQKQTAPAAEDASKAISYPVATSIEPYQEKESSSDTGTKSKEANDVSEHNNEDNTQKYIDPLFIHKPDNDGSENYQTAKAEWVKNYPEEYDRWLKSNTDTGSHKISAKEFKAMPKEKQDNILNNRDKYIIVNDE